MRLDILTLFPGMFVGPFDHSMIARAREAGLVHLEVHDLRAWADDRHRTTDDYAYGGGGGMVLRAEPVFRAVESLLDIAPITSDAPVRPPASVVITTPQGRRLDDRLARELASEPRVVVVAGHYEGYDERIRLHLATHEVSVGDVVLTGGELPAMMVAEAVIRLQPGVVGSETATEHDSFAQGRLEHPHYTRPANFRGWRVPDVLLSGHHGEVDRWRRRQSLLRTAERRPDLLSDVPLDEDERAWLESWLAEPPDPGSDRTS